VWCAVGTTQLLEPSLCAQVWYAVETTDREDAQLLVETLNKARPPRPPPLLVLIGHAASLTPY
jgi:hypothetical protein